MSEWRTVKQDVTWVEKQRISTSFGVMSNTLRFQERSDNWCKTLSQANRVVDGTLGG